jgi:transcriptional regulator with XRE-family HTH domain
MGFKENLKNELIFKNMLVKELSAQSGVNLHSINNYLNTRGRIPSAESAVKIAQALGVSVEYLVTGQEANGGQTIALLAPETRSLMQVSEQLPDSDRYAVLQFAEFLRGQKKKL